MPLLWFLAGILTTLGCFLVLWPMLRNLAPLRNLTAIPKPLSIGGLVIVVAALVGLYQLGRPDAPPKPAALAAARTATPDSAVASGPMGSPKNMSIKTSDTGGAFGTAAKVFGDATGTSNPVGSAASTAGAGSMDTAISNLEARLAKGGGSKDDWELLAKSFEFLGRPADAAKARAHQIPAVSAGAAVPGPMVAPPSAAAAPAAGAGTAVSGEVTLAPDLKAKAAVGETLFIVAKSVDSPGIPVAVFRGSVGTWPLKFTLDDSQSMLPGRTLSSVGRVTVEARISQKGQPLPSAGDLQGSSGIINPADHQSLKITIDRVIT